MPFEGSNLNLDQLESQFDLLIMGIFSRNLNQSILNISLQILTKQIPTFPMNKIYDHQKLCHHKRLVIPQNIRLGQMISELLNGVDSRLLKKVVTELKKEYQEEHNDIFNTKEKRDHVQLVLDKIAVGKYDFAKQNIEEGQKFNQFYEDAQIPLPVQQKKFKCEFCHERSFKTNASLHSHYRSCNKKNLIQESSQERKLDRNEGRPFRKRQVKEVQPKAKRVLVQIIRQEKEQVKKEEKEEKPKRDRPVSTFSFESDIFYGDQ